MRHKCIQRREESCWSESLLDKAVGEMYAEAEDVVAGGCVVGPGGRQREQPQSERKREQLKEQPRTTVARVNAGACSGGVRRFEKEVGAMLLIVFTDQDCLHLIRKANRIDHFCQAEGREIPDKNNMTQSERQEPKSRPECREFTGMGKKMYEKKMYEKDAGGPASKTSLTLKTRQQ